MKLQAKKVNYKKDGNTCATTSTSRAYLTQIKLKPESFMLEKVVEN